MGRTDSFEKTLILGKIEGRRRRGQQRMRWLDCMSLNKLKPTQWTWVWVSSGSWWCTGKPGVLQCMGSQRVGHDWATELNWRVVKNLKWDNTCKDSAVCLAPSSPKITVLINNYNYEYILLCCAKSPQLCLILCDSMDYTHQAPLSTEFSMQEYWSELSCPPSGHLPNPGIEPTSLMSPALAGWFFTTVLLKNGHSLLTSKKWWKFFIHHIAQYCSRNILRSGSSLVAVVCSCLKSSLWGVGSTASWNIKPWYLSDPSRAPALASSVTVDGYLGSYNLPASLQTSHRTMVLFACKKLIHCLADSSYQMFWIPQAALPPSGLTLIDFFLP